MFRAYFFHAVETSSGKEMQRFTTAGVWLAERSWNFAPVRFWCDVSANRRGPVYTAVLRAPSDRTRRYARACFRSDRVARVPDACLFAPPPDRRGVLAVPTPRNRPWTKYETRVAASLRVFLSSVAATVTANDRTRLPPGSTGGRPAVSRRTPSVRSTPGGGGGGGGAGASPRGRRRTAV